MIAAALLLKVTVILILALAGTRLARHSRAAVRHVLLAASFGALLILPIASLVAPTVRIEVPAAMQVAISAVESEPIVEVTDTVTPPFEQRAAVSQSSNWSVAVVLMTVWLAGIVVFLSQVILGLSQVRSLRRSALPWNGADGIVSGTGMRRRVDVLRHESLAGPMTCGVLRPAIVLPGDATTWAEEDLRRAIVHELAHVRRGDWASQIFARIATAVYWFHPIVWVAWRRLSLEAERACDDAVLLSSADPSVAYADQLVVLAQRLSTTSSQPHLAMANRSDLATRVVAVLDSGQRRGRAGAVWVGVAAAACAMLVITISPLRLVAATARDGSQTPAGQATLPGKVLRYDAASIKPCEPEEVPTGARGTAGGTNATATPGRFFVPCVTTQQLIYLAYAAYGVGPGEHLINDDSGNASNTTKVRGGPDWVHSGKVKYSIEATAAGVTDRLVLMGAMLRTLLEERFKLKVHRDVEEAPMYSLTVGKGGFKLKPMKEGDCDPDAVMGIIPSDAKPRCGALNMVGIDGNTRTRWTFGGHDMSNLAGRLTSALKMHVIDNTNIKGQFVFRFEFPRDPDPLVTETGIFAAVEEQLGLKLEKVKGPRGFLVIDAIERPSPDLPSVFELPLRARAAGGPK